MKKDKKKKKKPVLKQMGKLINGRRYVSADEKYDYLMKTVADYGYKDPGIAEAIYNAKMHQGYSMLPRVKPSKKK